MAEEFRKLRVYIDKIEFYMYKIILEDYVDISWFRIFS